jgi:hypothetical protein
MILEAGYWRSAAAALARPSVAVVPYIPARREVPQRQLKVPSAWDGIQFIIADIIERFGVGTERCLEFGVEFGFSTAVLSSYFDSVIGVDTFVGDAHTANRDDIYSATVARLTSYSNVQLVRNDYRNFIKDERGSFDLIHIDIVHSFADTHACGLWSAKHSQCAIFHDTESFPQVKRAVIEIARQTGKTFYNFPESFGLGILV